jgi:hypothetical protein
LNRTEFQTPPTSDAADKNPGDSNLARPAALWFAVAVIALAVLYGRLLHSSFDGDFQGWASASCMTMAHSFNQLGALHTHFVPIQNNLPLGSDPDVYLHWPPLFPLLLSVVTRVLGDHESSGRLFALVITLATACVVVAIGRRLYGTCTGLLSGFFFLTARTSFEGGRAVLHQPLAMFFGASTVLFFLLAVDAPSSAEQSPSSRGWVFAALGLIATVCTVLTAWDPIFISLGLLVSSIYLRHRNAVRLAALYLVAGVVTFFTVQADYIFSYPALFKNQFATIAYRAGIKFDVESSTRLHTIVDRVHYGVGQLSFLQTCSAILRWIFQSFGDFTLLAAFLFLAVWLQSNRRKNDAAVYIIGGLGFPWLLFYALMRNYVSIHPFALVLGAPFLAISSGFVLGRIWEFFSAADGPRYPYLLRVMTIVFPLLTLFPIITYIGAEKTTYGTAEFADLSAVIGHNTLPNTVTLSPSESAVPIYYSDRHIVRGIATPDLLRDAIKQARSDFPGSPLFFALRDVDRPSFGNMLSEFNPVARQGDSAIYAIP